MPLQRRAFAVSLEKQAIKAEYRKQVKVKRPAGCTGSVDLDAHFEKIEPDANRWDYGVGFKKADADRDFVLWIEPHPASRRGNVDEVIKKLDWLKEKLKTAEFKDLSDLTEATKAKGEMPFRWIYKGTTIFRAGGKAAKLLALKGMELPKRYLEVG